MKEIFLVTHPEATHHTAGLVGGWYDSELTDLGYAHAERIASALGERVESLAELYSSDLLRTAQTADAIARALKIRPEFMEGLREKSYGEAGGMPDAWFRERFVPPPKDGERLQHDEGIPGAETKWDCVKRVYAAMDRISASDANQKIIVTHGGSAQLVIAHWIGMPMESVTHVGFRLGAGSITHLVEDDYFHNRSVGILNSTVHLN